jgi:hypothetical protein
MAEGEFGKVLLQIEDRLEGSFGGFPGFFYRPQPGHIQVSMTQEFDLPLADGFGEREEGLAEVKEG